MGGERPVLLSPLARGADQIAAEAALRHGYRLVALLPFPLAEYRADFPGPALARLEALLARAERVETVTPREGERRGYVLAGEQTVAGCDVLAAVWDGGASRGPGGTADVVACALQEGRPVIHLPLAGGDPLLLRAGAEPQSLDRATLDALVAGLGAE